jgi:predicted GNAT superfamily acetyltransferase
MIGLAPVRTTNGGQIEQTLRELRRLGRIEKVDAAAVQAVRSMARALDADPQNAALWRQYREALRELTADDSDDSADVALAELFAEVGDAPPP